MAKDPRFLYADSEDSLTGAERLALPTSDHEVAGSNPAGGEILPEPKRRFIAQSLSWFTLPSSRNDEILLKGRKTLTHSSISDYTDAQVFLSFFLYVLTSVEDIRRGSVYKCKVGGGGWGS